MMKTGLIFLVVIAFVAADDSIDQLNLQMSHCQQTSLIKGTSCSDYSALEQCLQDIDPADDIQQNILTQYFNYVESERKKCPGLNMKETCVYNEIVNCTTGLNDIDFAKENDAICEAVPKTQDCLIRLNNSCTEDVVLSVMANMDKMLDLCKIGHYNPGPCSFANMTVCTLLVASALEVKDGELVYTCKPDDVEYGEYCLANMIQNCQHPTIQRELQGKLKNLNDICPSTKKEE